MTVGDRVGSFLTGQVALITGVTGFLGKPLVEKLLRSVPDVEHLYLLIRPKLGSEDGAGSAQDRFEREVTSSGAFDRLREEWGRDFHARLRDMVTPVAGDLTKPRLGLSDQDHERLTQSVGVIINSAAVVVFDEPLDSAVRLNVLAASHVVDFAQACPDPVLLHVSTAYVSGRNNARVFERLLPQEEDAPDGWKGPVLPASAADEASRLEGLCEEVERESRLPRRVDQWRREAARGVQDPADRDAQVNKLREVWIRERMIRVGMDQAHARRWNDTYTYTKALGEQFIDETRGDLRVGVIRPSIIESSVAEPEPGWIDGYRMADPIIIGFGKARVPDFPAHRKTVMDFIPVDSVVNAVLVASWDVSTKRGLTVYHVATGATNPMTFDCLYTSTEEYFHADPMLDRQGHPIRTPNWSFPTLATFQRQNRWWRLGPVKLAVRLLAAAPLGSRVRRLRQRLTMLQSGLERLGYYGAIYGPYVRGTYVFDTTRTRELFGSLTAEESEIWPFRIDEIDWARYLKEIHIPGLKRNVLKLGPGAPRPPIAEEGASPAQDDPPAVEDDAQADPVE